MSGIIEINGIFVNHFILYDEQDIVLIDTGFLLGFIGIKRALKRIGKTPKDITKILLTHGHFDHGYNLYKLQQISGAEAWGMEVEQLHLEQKYPYEGINKFTGFAEKFGAFTLNYKPGKIHHFISDNEVLPFCGGFKVVHLPGHTKGHSGFIHIPTQTLFNGDIINTRSLRRRLAPKILNSCHELTKPSLARMYGLEEVKRMMSNHGPRWTSPEKQWEKFKRIYVREFKDNH